MKLEIDDAAREFMFEELCEEFGETAMRELLRSAMVHQVTEMYDNRARLRQKLQSNE